MACTESSLRAVIDQHGGVLHAGTHFARYGEPDCPLCIMEAHAACLVAQGLRETITDDPEELGRPDYRPLNDAAWSSSEARTQHMIRLHAAYDGWADWSCERRSTVIDRIVIETVRQIIAALPGLPDEVRDLCRLASDRTTAYDAAASAWTTLANDDSCDDAWSAAGLAVRAADAAYDEHRISASAARAADAVDDAERDRILIRAVDIWIEAAGH